jgi:tetratricopeptide (TPR) repeat protein
MSVLLGYDPVTLREHVDLLEVGRRLEELGDMRNLDAMCERAWLLKVGGRLDEALEQANAALRLSRFTGERRDVLSPRILRATIMQADDRLDDALVELSACVDEANTQQWHALEAVAKQHRGKVYFELGRLPEALADFRSVLRTREDAGASSDQLASTRFAIEVVEQRMAA